MILVNLRFRVRPELLDSWLQRMAEYAALVREEGGNVFFELIRSADEPATFYILEAFEDERAEAMHDRSPYVQDALNWVRDHVADVPEVVYVGDAPDGGWQPLEMLAPR